MFKICPSKIKFTENRLQAGDVIEDEESTHVRTGEPQLNSDNDTDDPLHSIDLNSEPVDMYGWQEIADEDVFTRGKSKKAKNKDKKQRKSCNAKFGTITMKPKDVLKANAYRRNKKSESSHKSHISPSKSDNSISISEEIIKTKKCGFGGGLSN